MHAVQTHRTRATARRATSAALAAAFLAAAVTLIVRDGGGTWQLVAFLAAPDLALLLGFGRGLEKGRLHPRAVPFYNAAHSFWGPVLLAAASLVVPGPWL